MKKMMMLFLTLALMCGFVGNCMAKQLTVATDTNFPPFEFKDPKSGKHTGFDIELWDAIAKEIGVAYKLQPMDFNGIIPGLQSGQLDVGIAGMSIKPERAKVIDFSDPYYKAGLLLLVRSNNKEIAGIENLGGKTVATKLGTSSEDYLKKHTKAKDIKLYPNNDAMFMELMTGGADAVFFDSPVIAHYIQKVGRGKVKVVGPLYGLDAAKGSNYGIGFPKGSPLVSKVNKAMKNLKDNGTYRKLYRKWFNTDPK